MRDPVTVQVGARMRIPSGLQHRCIVVEEGAKAAAMCRQIRADLRGCVTSVHSSHCGLAFALAFAPRAESLEPREGGRAETAAMGRHV